MRRRTVLAWGAGAAGAAAFAGPGAARAATPRSATGRATVVTPAVRPIPVEGTGLTVPLLAGPAATALVYVIRRFHYEIDTLLPGEVTADPSGTAIDIRPGWYPPGVTGGLFPHQLIVVRDILAECDAVIGWGGDSTSRPAESRFELAAPPADRRLEALATRLSHPSTEPGADMAAPFTPARVKRATAIHRRTTR